MLSKIAGGFSSYGETSWTPRLITSSSGVDHQRRRRCSRGQDGPKAENAGGMVADILGERVRHFRPSVSPSSGCGYGRVALDQQDRHRESCWHAILHRRGQITGTQQYWFRRSAAMRSSATWQVAGPLPASARRAKYLLGQTRWDHSRLLTFARMRRMGRLIWRGARKVQQRRSRSCCSNIAGLRAERIGHVAEAIS